VIVHPAVKLEAHNGPVSGPMKSPSRKRRSGAQLPPEYYAVARQRDQWFGFLTLGTIVTLGSMAVGTVFGPALIATFAGVAWMLFAGWRFVVLTRASSRIMSPWFHSHTYRGPWPRILGPMQRFTAAQPILVGVMLAVGVVGFLILAILVRHMVQGY
jgi:hypothetical protein